jgi:hypothetical protein
VYFDAEYGRSLDYDAEADNREGGAAVAGPAEGPGGEAADMGPPPSPTAPQRERASKGPAGRRRTHWAPGPRLRRRREGVGAVRGTTDGGERVLAGEGGGWQPGCGAVVKGGSVGGDANGGPRRWSGLGRSCRRARGGSLEAIGRRGRGQRAAAGTRRHRWRLRRGRRRRKRAQAPKRRQLGYGTAVEGSDVGAAASGGRRRRSGLRRSRWRGAGA